MDSLQEKVSDLKRLADALCVDENTKEGKLLLAIINTLEDIGCAVDALQQEELFKPTRESFRYMCPNCNEPIEIEDSAFEEEHIICPKCSEPIIIDTQEL